MRTDISSLIQRVEGLSGPSREVDALVICALLAPEGSKVEQSPFNGAWCIYEPRRFGKEPFGLWDKSPVGRGAEVTRSIDAALSLVERMLPEAYPKFEKNGGTSWHAWILDEPEAEQGYYGINSSPALAILSALLRALHQGGENV